MSLAIEAPLGVDHSPQTFLSPLRSESRVSPSELMQPRGVLLSSSEPESGRADQANDERVEINGKSVGVEVFNYRKHRLRAMAGDWNIINTEFPGQFAVPDYGKQAEARVIPAINRRG